MKRFHVHAHVQNLADSIRFYSKLFGAEPTRIESDYAKWMLEDPRLNFAISTRGGTPGVDHLGFQVDEESELAELRGRADAAEGALLDEGETTCCYARSRKHWVTDPQGIAWEQFHTLSNIPTFSATRASIDAAPAVAAMPSAAALTALSTETAAAGACCPPRGKPVGVPVNAARGSGCC